MRPYSKEDIRKISLTGRGSYYIIIPKHMIEELGWRGKQKVKIKKGRGEIVIRDWKKN